MTSMGQAGCFLFRETSDVSKVRGSRGLISACSYHATRLVLNAKDNLSRRVSGGPAFLHSLLRPGGKFPEPRIKSLFWTHQDNEDKKISDGQVRILRFPSKMDPSPIINIGSWTSISKASAFTTTPVEKDLIAPVSIINKSSWCKNFITLTVYAYNPRAGSWTGKISCLIQTLDDFCL